MVYYGALHRPAAALPGLALLLPAGLGCLYNVDRWLSNNNNNSNTNNNNNNSNSNSSNSNSRRVHAYNVDAHVYMQMHALKKRRPNNCQTEPNPNNVWSTVTEPKRIEPAPSCIRYYVYMSDHNHIVSCH